MTGLRILLARLLGLFGRSAGRERELRAEIDAHIAEARRNRAQGVRPTRRAAGAARNSAA